MSLTDMFSRTNPQPPRREVTAEELANERLDSKIDREVLANLTLFMWTAYADSFRPDEQHHEQQTFLEAAGDLPDRIAQLPPTKAPDAGMVRRMLGVISQHSGDRIEALHERMTDILQTLRERDREINTIKLSTSWQIDELERCRMMIKEALRGRETALPNQAGGVQPLISELLAVLLNVQRPTPPPQAHGGRRRESGGDAAQNTPRANTALADDQEEVAIRKVLQQVVDGTASAGKLGRVLGDVNLARKLADMAADNRTYRHTLKRIGLLPPD